MNNLADLQKRARESLANQQGLIRSTIRGQEFTDDEIADEMRLLQEQDRRASQVEAEKQAEISKQNEQEFDARLNRKAATREMELGNTIDPKLMDYAYNIFPSLNQIAPKSNVQVPMAAEEESQEELPNQEDIGVTPAVAPQREPSSAAKVTSPQISTVRSPASQPETPTPKAQDYDKMLDQMQEQQRGVRYAERLAKFRDAAIGAGLGKKFETDYEMYGELQKEAAAPIQKIKIIQELESNKAKNDPNSDISKLIRKSLTDLGVNMADMDNVSYAQIEKLYPSVANAMMTKLAVEARKEEAALTRQLKAEAKADKEETRNEVKYEKTRAIVNNKIAKLQETKTSPFAGYGQAKQTSQMIDNAIEAWDNSDEDAKIKNSVAFMQYAKIAQGDDSVVRSSDMQALAGGLNYSSPYALLNKFAAKAEGSPFTKGELVEMKKVIDTIRKIKKQQLQQRLDPIRLDAQRGGYDLDQSISPDIIEEIYSPEPMSVVDKAKRLEELRKKQGK